MVVNFTLLDGITWSDGEPLTAQDSVFSFTVSAESENGTSRRHNIDRTFSYTVLDDNTAQWIGQPGYLTLNPAAFFWSPLPQHALARPYPEQMTS